MASILIIDDEPGLRLLVSEMLNAAGHKVTEAPNGKQGEALAQESRPELILMDVWMPGQDGIATIMNIRKHTPEAKVLVMSGMPNGAGLRVFDIARSISGVVGTLKKPFSHADLVSRVDAALEAR